MSGLVWLCSNKTLSTNTGSGPELTYWSKFTNPGPRYLTLIMNNLQTAGEEREKEELLRCSGSHGQLDYGARWPRF